MEGTLRQPRPEDLVRDERQWRRLRVMIKTDQVPIPRLWQLFQDNRAFASWYAAEETLLRAHREDQLVAQHRLDGYPWPDNVVPFRKRA